MEMLVMAGFLAAGGFTFLMLIAGARRGVLANAELEQRRRAEEEAKRGTEQNAATEVFEAGGVD